MSSNEKLRQLASVIPEKQASVILKMAENYLQTLDDALDDAFCQKLWEEAEEDTDKSTLSLAECMKELGFNEKELQNL